MAGAGLWVTPVPGVAPRPEGAVGWPSTAEAITAVLTLGRLAALAGCGYVGIVAGLTALARWLGAHRLERLAARLATRSVRHLLRTTTTATMAAGLLVPAATPALAFAADPAVTAPADGGPAGTPAIESTDADATTAGDGPHLRLLDPHPTPRHENSSSPTLVLLEPPDSSAPPPAPVGTGPTSPRPNGQPEVGVDHPADTEQHDRSPTASASTTAPARTGPPTHHAPPPATTTPATTTPTTTSDDGGDRGRDGGRGGDDAPADGGRAGANGPGGDPVGPHRATEASAPPSDLPGGPWDPSPSVTNAAVGTVPSAVPTDDAPAMASWTIQPGEHLWRVAEAVVEAGGGRTDDIGSVAEYHQRLIAHNRTRLPVPDDPDLVFPGTVVECPPLDP